MSMSNPLSLSERLHSALNQSSLIVRVQEVSQLLQEVSSKDGGYILRTIIESLFGFGISDEGTMGLQQQQLGGGWGLRIITQTEHCDEFKVMRNFLSPNGPLLNLIYRLSHDPSQLLPFPIICLPAKVRGEIQEGNAGPFYTSRIQNLGPGKNPTNILFNAFEYYFFHFGYFLVGNGAQHWNLFWTSVRDALYPTLFEDYLSSYLPCDANLPPGPPTAPVSPRGILSPVSQSPHSLSLLVSPIATPFRSPDHNPYMDMGTVGSMGHHITHQTSSPIHPTVSQTSEVSTWTSQALIQVLMEIWINLCISPPKVTTGHHPAPGFTPMSPSPSFGHCHPTLRDIFVPVADHVRAVRMMVKHFHYFTNSQKPQYPSPLDYLRRNIWPMCRKSLYHFVEHLFIHWPLDSSFRLVLETWLSYIQPWRYIKFMSLERTLKMAVHDGDIPRSVELKWKGFIAENLLFYSHLFSLFLNRTLKLDLASPKNAQILFRVAKVFCQENLFPMIQEVEDLLESNQMQKSSLSLGFVGGLGSPCAIPSVQDSTEGHHLPQVIAQMARSHILELKPNYHYTPMFGDAVLTSVVKLVRMMKRTCDTLIAELTASQGSASVSKTDSAGWFSSLLKALFESPRARDDENSAEEMSKCVSHLEASMNQFCILFDVAIPDAGTTPGGQRIRTGILGDSGLGTPEKMRIPDQTITDSGLTLTDFGRNQVLSGLRRMDLKFEGDPDLRPICTFEVGFLVRLLYSLSNYLNTKYKRQLSDFYYRQDFLGSVSRVFIKAPETVYEYRREIEVDGFQRKWHKELPPRISFRPIAHKKVLLFLSIGYLFLWMCGLSFTGVSFQVLIPSFILYILCKAALQGKSSVTRL